MRGRGSGQEGALHDQGQHQQGPGQGEVHPVQEQHRPGRVFVMSKGEIGEPESQEVCVMSKDVTSEAEFHGKKVLVVSKGNTSGAELQGQDLAMVHVSKDNILKAEFLGKEVIFMSKGDANEAEFQGREGLFVYKGNISSAKFVPVWPSSSPRRPSLSSSSSPVMSMNIQIFEYSNKLSIKYYS